MKIDLKIVKLVGDKKFYNTKRNAYVLPEGYVFFNEERGYLSFKKNPDSNHPHAPYRPIGGKAALQMLLNHGGIEGISDEDIEWLQGE